MLSNTCVKTVLKFLSKSYQGSQCFVKYSPRNSPKNSGKCDHIQKNCVNFKPFAYNNPGILIDFKEFTELWKQFQRVYKVKGPKSDFNDCIKSV